MANRYGKYLSPSEIHTVAVVGTGSVGASWAALFLAQGLNVVASDPGSDAEAKAREFVQSAWPALLHLNVTVAASPPLERMKFVSSAGEAAEQAQFVQENAPENPALKARVLAEITEALAPTGIVGSSTGGIMPSVLQSGCRHPERIVVLHPFNPAHLIPLVEVIGGRETAPEVVRWAHDFALRLGKQPIVLKKEATGHLTNRLQFALIREAVHCLVEGIASAEDIDASVRFGLGPRWALMGGLMTLHLAGGAGGMKGILDHAGNAIENWWAALGTPRLTPEVRETLVAAAAEIARGGQVADWVSWRDQKLLRVLKAIAEPPAYGKFKA